MGNSNQPFCLSRWLTPRRRALFCLALFFSGQLCMAVDARFPFPQQVTYSFGIKPTSQSQSTMNSDCQRIYDAFRKSYVTNSGCPPGGYRVHCGSSLGYQTRSEGIAWGMLISVYMDNSTNHTRTLFDGFDTYRRAYMNTNGFMYWLVKSDGTLDSTGPAIEADQNMALALLLAHYQWGSDSNTDYQTEATILISNLMARCVLKPKYIIKPFEGSGLNLLHPCAWNIGYYKLFHQFSGDGQWTNVLNSSLNLINGFYTNVNTGLMPHWCNQYGGPTGNADPYFADYTYEYDACQTPLKYGLYHLWNGAGGSDRPYQQCKRMAGWINTVTAGNPNTIRDNYNLDGTLGANAQYNANCFVATFSVAAMMDPIHQSWLNTLYDNLRNRSASEYYNTLIQLVSMLVISGNFPDLMALSLQSDSDGDGLPDNWETLNFGSITNSAGSAQDDYDLDGFIDQGEYVAGTGATNAQSRLRVNVRSTNQVVIVSWPMVEASGAGYFGKRRYYDLLTATNLVMDTWSPVTEATHIPGAPGSFRYTNAIPAAEAFYKVKARLQ